jgi:NADH-quinone oxidoreductase subunit I
MWGLGVIKGFGITMRNFFRGPITVQYPEKRIELPPRSRWAVRHKYDENGAPKCTACLICVKECPDDVLRIFSSPKEGGGKRIDAYVYEVGACMMCGLCVAACPFDAIEMSHEYELATRDRADLVRVLLRDVDAAGPKRTPREEAPADAEAPVLADAPVPAPVDAPAPSPGKEARDA